MAKQVDLSGFGLESLSQIGRGQYANAQLVRETATGSTYVAKCVSLAALNEHDQDLAHQEVFLLQTLSNPYIVAYRDSFLIEGANTLVIVMEYCDRGDLRKAIKEKSKAGEHFAEEQVMTWFVQLCLALQYIHSEKVLHRDLKTSNIFLTVGPNGEEVVKLGDFGISRVLENTTDGAVTIVGTPYYMSPEVCRSEPYNWKSDIWALGCVLYELCMLKHAFESSSLIGLVYKIVSDHYEPIPSFYSQELNDLIRRLLMKGADHRPSINEIFAIPYVKAYLARMTVHAPPPAVPESPQLRPKRPTLKQSAGRPRTPPPPAAPHPPPQPPGPPPMGPESFVVTIAARIRRRIVGQKLNWISAVASFDPHGCGALEPEGMRNALASMLLGLSEDEIVGFVDHLAAEAGGAISLDLFNGHISTLAPEVQDNECWARQILAPAGKRFRELLIQMDTEQQGTITPQLFQVALKEVAPVVTPSQLDVLVLMADKNYLGDVEYMEFIRAYGAPLAPPAPAEPGTASPQRPKAPGPAAPPGFMPLPGAGRSPGPGAPPRPAKMAPLPGAPPGPGPVGIAGGMTPSTAPGSSALGNSGVVDLSMTSASAMSMGDIGLGASRTFFTCTAKDFTANAGNGAIATGWDLNAQGCKLVLSRIRRRLDAAGLPAAEAFGLFASPGERELAGEQWLAAVSSLPLGASIAEMQQVFSSLDRDNTGKISLSMIQSAVEGTPSELCTRPPMWIMDALRRGLCANILDAFRNVGEGQATLAREGDLRRVIMLSEKYLSSDRLTSLLLLADKTHEGLVDYQEFAERLGSDGSTFGIVFPGGILPPIQPAMGLAAAPTAEELNAVGSRVGALLERQGFPPERLSALLALWGPAALQDEVAASLLASLPLGVSTEEAACQVASMGGVEGFAANLANLQAQGMWARFAEWGMANIPGQALRSVLERQLNDAESRTLDREEFTRAILDAGSTPANAQIAVWLAEKTAQGDVRVAEFLERFGGARPVEKKKKSRFFRLFGR